MNIRREEKQVVVNNMRVGGKGRTSVNRGYTLLIDTD